MNTLLSNILYNKITKKITGGKWIERMAFNKREVEQFTKSSNLKKGIEKIVVDRDYSCKNVLELCRDFLNTHAGKKAPKDWLSYIYEYTLFKSFPDAVTIELDESLNPYCEFYLRILKVICDFEKSSDCGSWQSKYPMNFITEDEEAELENPDEYLRFLKAFKHNNTYEMMKLNGEICHFNTLDHICGVHYLALFIARQLKKAGIPVDLGRVSGSAAGHDIGKYGCKKEEAKRVPYLHYYYTDQWFKRYKINYIRNIALNHSTWDLELENLSLESLILIYSDFRVKNKAYTSKPEMYIYSLEQSFDVILHKLDNVNDYKERRYRRVYAKLKDFEDYIINLGINVDVEKINESNILDKSISKPFSLLQGNEIIDNFKYLSINHNINLMYRLRDEYSLDMILEAARSEKDWKNFRVYIRIFEEYSTYLTQGQKLQTIKFLYENLTHPEDDIRRHCAELLGTLIAIYDEEYRKDIPEHVELETPAITSFKLLKEYIDLILFPSPKIIPEHRWWIGYCFSSMICSFFSHCREAFINQYEKIVLDYFDENISSALDTRLFLLEAAKFIPINSSNPDTEKLYYFIVSMLNKHSNTLKLSALEVSYSLLASEKTDTTFKEMLKQYFVINMHKSKSVTENFLKYKIVNLLSLDEHSDLVFELKNSFNELESRKIQEIYLSNLKTATNWIKKRAQVDLLLEYAINDETPGAALHAAIHFCNLLKVSAVETVRNRAGNAILQIMPKLSPAEKNEVAVELLRAMEIEGNKFTEYIPYYMGHLVLYLQPKELDEIIDDLFIKIKNSNSNIKSLILKTLGITISRYSLYSKLYDESEVIYSKRLLKLLGILLNGLGDYTPSVKQAAFNVIGKDIFGNETLDFHQKVYIFKQVGKKILTMITDYKNEDLLFLTNSACLNHIYRFMSDYSFFVGKIDIKIADKVAFFPGTFDPFSLSHKAIATSIRDLGYEVYLYTDEFSWSKKTLPTILRKNIISMSIASEPNIYIYPDDFPTNISNPRDLKRLRENFPKSKVYIAVGSDVILNASAYKNTAFEDSIHTFPHIVFQRGNIKKIDEISKNISGDIQWVTLPQKYLEISSTQIRNSIDDNRDISSLIDPLAQNYIYENGFYQKQPQNKTSIKSLWLDVEVHDKINNSVAMEICDLIGANKDKIFNKLMEISDKPSARVIMLRDSNQNNELLAFSVIHWVRSGMLYNEIKNVDLSRFIRTNSIGRILMIDGMYIKDCEKNCDLNQVLITETLTSCIARDYEYAIFKENISELVTPSIKDLLKLQGFLEIDSEDDNSILVVNMSSPCVLNLDLENIIKEPFISNTKIKKVVASTRKNLQESLCKLFPGELVLSFDSGMMHQRMIKKICTENGVTTDTTENSKLGPAMCVPYGDILDRYIVPNTVTKALHTEKLFEPSLKKFTIGQFPHYLDLPNQVKMIKSFEKPVILVDNILHKGYRMTALDPLFKNENIKVQKIVAGILSGIGKDLMDMQNREVTSVYFIPRLKIWFNENALYPFIGGDALWRGDYPKRNLLPSINLILPYTSPGFIRGASSSSIFNLSRVCLENAINLMEVIESEYHLIHERTLTLSYLGQVFTIPRCPEHGKNMDFDLNLCPSHYIKNDLELLNRLEYILKSSEE